MKGADGEKKTYGNLHRKEARRKEEGSKKKLKGVEEEGTAP